MRRDTHYINRQGGNRSITLLGHSALKWIKMRGSSRSDCHSDHVLTRSTGLPHIHTTSSQLYLHLLTTQYWDIPNRHKHTYTLPFHPFTWAMLSGVYQNLVFTGKLILASYPVSTYILTFIQRGNRAWLHWGGCSRRLPVHKMVWHQSDCSVSV